MQELSLPELLKNVKQWSDSRGILEQSTWEKQIQKYFSERAELFTTSDYEDSYGDMMVCLINASLLEHTRTVEIGFDQYSIGNMIDISLAHGDTEGAMLHLAQQCQKVTGNAERCYAKAWNEIKKRAGLMIEGTYVKWDNLNQPQRLECAKRGQLAIDGIDLDHCKSFCTEVEWAAICDLGG